MLTLIKKISLYDSFKNVLILDIERLFSKIYLNPKSGPIYGKGTTYFLILTI